MVTRIDICNRALSRIGAVSLQSEEADGAELVLNAYEDTLEILLGLNNGWKFATRFLQLGKVAADTGEPFGNHFKLPPDRISAPRHVTCDANARRPFHDYTIEGDLLKSSASAIWVLYTVRPDPLVMPPLFRQCLQLALAADLAARIREDYGLADALKREVYGDARAPGQAGLLAQAKAADAQTAPSPVLAMAGGPLVEARLGWSDWPTGHIPGWSPGND